MTTSVARAATRAMWRSLAGPTGSFERPRSRGSLARSAKRFTISTPPNPQRRAKATQRRIVGSSPRSSAVEGFSMTNATLGSALHRRQRR